MTKELLKGNVAIAEAAVRAGCEAYFGYPITPQTELLEHMAVRMPELGRVFLQAESEVAAINMVYGAASAGVRVMTSSSSPGISLMQEGFSYIAGSEVPVVIVDVMRGGPGLGNIQPSQSDYNQVVKQAGHGDFHPIVLAPATVQEAIDLMGLAFDLADKYRTLAFLVLDGALGQMMEPAELPPMRDVRAQRPSWALTGQDKRRQNGRLPEKNIITSIHMSAEEMSVFNLKLQNKLAQIEAQEVRYLESDIEDAEVIVVAFGTAGRVAQSAIKNLRQANVPVGLLRPITLWPFPEKRLQQLATRAKAFLVVEMNAGQMFHDVREAVGRSVPVEFFGRMGGLIPFTDEIEQEIKTLWRRSEVLGMHKQ
jgi:2-oxoglutarate/2-oxoacid ferredoxin oxidoreductase subunit alpha